MDLQVFRSFNGVNVGGNADSDVTANGPEATLTYQPTTAFNIAATFAYSQSELDEDDPAIGGLEGEQPPAFRSGRSRCPATTTSCSARSTGSVGGGLAYQDSRNTSVQGRRRRQRRGDRAGEPELHDG